MAYKLAAAQRPMGLMNAKEAAAYLKVDRATITNMVAGNRLTVTFAENGTFAGRPIVRRFFSTEALDAARPKIGMMPSGKIIAKKGATTALAAPATKRQVLAQTTTVYDLAKKFDRSVGTIRGLLEQHKVEPVGKNGHFYLYNVAALAHIDFAGVVKSTVAPAPKSKPNILNIVRELEAAIAVVQAKLDPLGITKITITESGFDTN